MPSSCGGPISNGFAPSGMQTSVSKSLGWYNIGDFYNHYLTGGLSTTQWIQESINLALSTGTPLYFPPPAGAGIPTYEITASIIISGGVGPGPCHLLGPAAESSFTQAGAGSGFAVTGSTRAMIWSSRNDIDLLCIQFGGNRVIIENIDFCVVPPSGSGGGNAIHLINHGGAKISNSAMYGPWNGVYVDGSGGVELEDVTVIPCSTPVSGGRFGFKADGATSGNANDTSLSNCVVDQTRYPFSGPTGQISPHTVDGFVITNGYNTMVQRNCAALACNYGFLAEQTVTGGPSVNFFQVLDSETYNCNAGVFLSDARLTYVQGSRFVSDSASGTTPNASRIFGISVQQSVTSANIALTNNVISGNGTSPMIGIDLEGGPMITATGGSVMNCGPQVSGGLGDGIFISAAATGYQYALAGILVGGCTNAGVHVGAGHQGDAVLTALTLAGNRNSATSGSAGLLIDALTDTTIDQGFQSLAVAGCDIQGNDVAVSNLSSHITSGGPALAYKLENNVGYNPVGPITSPPVAAGPLYNNSGVDQYVYLEGTATVTIGTGLASAPGTGAIGATESAILVPAGGTIAVSGTLPVSWTWIGN